MTYNVALTKVSNNVKTGPMPVSTTTFETCPNDCPLMNNGCYAGFGPLSIHWRKVTEGLRGVSWEAFCVLIDKLPKGILWRHNQAGDLPGNRISVDRDAMRKLIKANKGKRGFTYTHYNVINNKENQEIVRYANNNGFTVNLSANNLAHADLLVKVNCGPVVTLLSKEIEGKQKITTQDGNIVVVCPATYNDEVSCYSCGLCAHVKRKTIVGFPAHGNNKNKASTISKGV